MNPIYQVAIAQVARIEALHESTGRHLIRTETIKEAVRERIDIGGVNEESDYLIDVGIGQVVQSVLYSKGYRSVQTGYFVNLDKCENPFYLTNLLNNAEVEEKAKIGIKQRIDAIRHTYCDGQYRFDANGDLIQPLTEEEFNEMLRRDAI